MGKFTFHPVKSLQSDPKLRMLCLFGIEGFLLQYAVSLYTLANNLYATNLGATDTQIGLVQMVPNMVAGICMIPVGFLANRTKTSRTVPFVLALFLKDLRPTIVVAISMPLSVLFAIVLMYFTGITFNILSLSGLALGVGMLVDNSVVVIENLSLIHI